LPVIVEDCFPALSISLARLFVLQCVGSFSQKAKNDGLVLISKARLGDQAAEEDFFMGVFSAICRTG